MVVIDVPSTRTPYFFSVPSRWRVRPRLSAVCPPTFSMMASGFSFAMTSRAEKGGQRQEKKAPIWRGGEGPPPPTAPLPPPVGGGGAPFFPPACPPPKKGGGGGLTPPFFSPRE